MQYTSESNFVIDIYPHEQWTKPNRFNGDSLNHMTFYHGGNHVTSKQQQWRVPLKNPIDSGKIFFDISVNTGQICMIFEADTTENISNMPMVCDFRTKIWLKSY